MNHVVCKKKKKTTKVCGAKSRGENEKGLWGRNLNFEEALREDLTEKVT